MAASNFARADFGLGAGLDLEIDGFYSDIVVFEGGLDLVEEAATEVLDVESVFDADADVAVFGRKQGGVLEPGGKVYLGNLLLELGEHVLPNVVHGCVVLLLLILL